MTSPRATSVLPSLCGQDSADLPSGMPVQNPVDSATTNAHVNSRANQAAFGGRSSKTAAHGVILTGPDRIIRTANTAFSAITGYTKDEIIGRKCSFLQGPLTDPRTVEAIRGALESRTEFSGKIRNYRKDGSVFWNHLTISPVHDAKGVLTHFIGIIRDLSASHSPESGSEIGNGTGDANDSVSQPTAHCTTLPRRAREISDSWRSIEIWALGQATFWLQAA